MLVTGDKKSEREARLAKALRENLKRRKAAARSKDNAVIPDLIRDPPSPSAISEDRQAPDQVRGDD
jgi:hypothetical protein